MKRIIYADNAATTRIDPAVLEAMEPFTKEDYANASQPYSFSRKAKAAIKNAREEIAKCINAKPSEIFFTSGGTESDNWAIKGCAFADESKRATITSTIVSIILLSNRITAPYKQRLHPILRHFQNQAPTRQHRQFLLPALH